MGNQVDRLIFVSKAINGNNFYVSKTSNTTYMFGDGVVDGKDNPIHLPTIKHERYEFIDYLKSEKSRIEQQRLALSKNGMFVTHSKQYVCNVDFGSYRYWLKLIDHSIVVLQHEDTTTKTEIAIFFHKDIFDDVIGFIEEALEEIYKISEGIDNNGIVCSA